MAEARFEQAIDIGVSPDTVHAYVADLHHYRDLHPLIERIVDLPPDPEHPAAHRYRVFDRLHVGPFSFRIAYVAELEPVSSSEIRGTAWQTLGIEVHTHYRVTPAPGGARLHEEAVLKAPRLLIGYAARQAEAAHRETLAKLKIRLEQRRMAPTAGTPAQPRRR